MQTREAPFNGCDLWHIYEQRDRLVLAGRQTMADTRERGDEQVEPCYGRCVLSLDVWLL